MTWYNEAGLNMVVECITTSFCIHTFVPISQLGGCAFLIVNRNQLRDVLACLEDLANSCLRRFEIKTVPCIRLTLLSVSC